MPALKRLCVGLVTGPHGIRGGLRVKSFTAQPRDLAAYGPVEDEGGGRRFTLKVTGEVKGVVLVSIAGVTTRDQAEAMKGMRLYVDRASLPAPEPEEFYHADLIGLPAELPDGSPLGKVAAVHEYGAGDSLEILRETGETVMLPFTKACVPVVDLNAGKLVVEPPAGLFEKPEPPAAIADQLAVAAEILEARP
jgi:16S rRNA processing protein RimM